MVMKEESEIQINNDEINIEDLIQEQEVVITLTHAGYIKRISADTYTAQKRGEKGYRQWLQKKMTL